jgi:hypothetical protein
MNGKEKWQTSPADGRRNAERETARKREVRERERERERTMRLFWGRE